MKKASCQLWFLSLSFFTSFFRALFGSSLSMPVVLQAAARQGALTSCSSSSSSSSSAPIPAPPRRLRTNGKLRRSLLMPASASAANSSPPADWDRTAVVIVDHGSRKAEANAELEEFASLYRCVCVCVCERERENSLSFKMRSLFADLLSFPLTKEKNPDLFFKNQAGQRPSRRRDRAHGAGQVRAEDISMKKGKKRERKNRERESISSRS